MTRHLCMSVRMRNVGLIVSHPALWSVTVGEGSCATHTSELEMEMEMASRSQNSLGPVRDSPFPLLKIRNGA